MDRKKIRSESTRIAKWICRECTVVGLSENQPNVKTELSLMATMFRHCVPPLCSATVFRHCVQIAVSASLGNGGTEDDLADVAPETVVKRGRS